MRKWWKSESAARAASFACLGVLISGLTLSALKGAPLPAGKRVEPKNSALTRRAGRTVKYGRLPLAFEPGQSGEETFVAHGDGYTIFVSPAETTLALRRAHGSGVLQMKFSGANQSGSLAASDELPGKSNYLLGNDSRKWRTNVANYRKVTQRGVYPGIDVVYYGTQRNLEYDFVVSPRANPGVVQLAFDGVQGLRTDREGDLLAAISGGEVRLHKPVAYQVTDGRKVFVAADYVVSGKKGARFELGHYDPGKALIIDPVLSYSTYLGGSNIDSANAIAVAPDMTAFIAGGTFSSDFPTAHPLQPNVGGANDFPQDAFVAKISADGSTLLYSTYLGGKNQDTANGIAVDSFGNAYVTGTTISPDFPVTVGSLFPLCGGDGKCGTTYNSLGLMVSNAFVTKLNVAGSGLVFSEFLGEYEHVHGQAIAVDDNQNIYVTGQVEANGVPTVTITPPNLPPPAFPITVASAFQPNFGGGTTDAFVTKFSSTGNSVLYSSYLGGTNEEIGYGIAADNTGVAYVTGLTYSSDFPVTAGPLQSAAGGAGDAFVAKVNTLGSGVPSLVFSTYLGGSGLDQGNAIALDLLNGNGNIYVAGTTNSALAANGFQTSNKGQGDAFVLKLTSGGAQSYLTFLGGSQADTGTGIAADSSGNVYVTGSSVSTDFPIAGTVFQGTFGGGNADAFVTKLDPTGKTLAYSSYLGGTNTDIGNGIAVDASGSAYVAGQTCSEDFPLSNPLQAGPGGNCDAFISKVSTAGGVAVNPAGLVYPAQSIGVTSAQQTVTIRNTNDSASVTISAITISGDFAQTNGCTAPLAAGATCTIAVTFHPTAAGIRKGTISITDNAPGSPQVVGLTGSTSAVTLSASSLSFGNQTVGIAAPMQSVTMTNSGTTTLTVSSIAASGDFSETNSCSASLPAGTNCVINVSYKPSAPGQSLGAVTITDGAPGSPQSILLTGTGVGQSTDFAISALPPTASVPAGNPATYTLTLTPVGGFSQPVALSCSGLPRGATCSFSANPAATGGTGTTTATLTIATALRTFVPPTSKSENPTLNLWNFGCVSFASIALTLCFLFATRRRRVFSTLGFATAILLLAGCNGGGQSGVPAGTPAGSYQVGVTGTSASLTHTVMLSLHVN